MTEKRTLTGRIAIAIFASLVCMAPFCASSQEVKIGVILSTTGPAASLGIFERNGLSIIEGQTKQKMKFVVVDDGTDTTQAARLAQRLMSEEKVDVIIGSTTTPSSLTITPLAADGKTPVISQAPSTNVVDPVDGPRRWVFKTTTNDDQEARPLLENIKATRTRTLAFIGFTDSYGEQWLRVTKKFATDNQIDLVDEERYQRTDASTASQVLKITSKNPDAILIAASGGAAATPLLELRSRGYRGRIYVTMGATFGDFIRIAGKNVDGLYAPFAAVMGVSQIPDGNPAKAGAALFVQAYDARFGAGSSNIFAAGVWDAVNLIDRAIPAALKSGAPGTPEFRTALRDALELTKDYTGARGIYNMTPTDHVGLDAASLSLGRYTDGQWVLQK